MFITIKKLVFFIFVLIVCSNAFALISTVCEEDGSPCAYPWKVNFPNGSITDNGDGTATYTPGAGAPHDPVTLAADIASITSISAGQELSLDTETANYVFAGPESGAAADPTFRALVANDIPDLSGVYEPAGVAVADITDASANGRSLISAANYAAMRGLLDLEAGTDFNAYDADLATLSAPGNWKVFYSDGSAAIQALTTGAANTVLLGNGTTSAPSFGQLQSAGMNWPNVVNAELSKAGVNWTSLVNVAPTAAGEIGVDTTSDQFVYYGGAKRVLVYNQRRCFGWFDPADADDNIEVWTFKEPATVTNISCRVSGGTSLAVVGGDGTNNFESITCDADGATDDGSITNATFTAGEVLELDCGAPSGTVPSFTYCIDYTIDSD